MKRKYYTTKQHLSLESTLEMSEFESLITYVAESIKDYKARNIELAEFLNRMEFAQYQYKNSEVNYE